MDSRPFFGAAALAAALAILPAQAQDKTTLRFFTIFDAPTVERWTPVLEAYQAANPNVEIKLETVAGSGAAVYPDVLRTAMASGDPPDVFFMWGGSIAEPLIKAGQVEPLDAYYEKYGWASLVAPWTIDRVKVDGKLYGVPYHARGMGFWYRTDTYQELGLTPPKTYAELEAICAKLKEGGKYCASFGGKFGWHTMRLLDYFIEGTCGPEKHDQLNRLEASWDDQCVVAAYDRMKSWIDKGWLVPDFLNVAPNDARMPVYTGEAAMVFEGPWFEGVLKADEQAIDGYDFFLPPTDQEPARYSAFPEQWMIPAASKNKDAAAAFIDWITRAENQLKFPEAFAGSATVGFKPDCTASPRECAWGEIIASDRQTYPPTDQAFTKELMDSFFEIQDGIVAGRIAPADGAKQMQARAEAYKAKAN